MTSKRIFILTLSVGTGHVRAAEVLQRAVDDCIDPVEVHLLHVLKVAHSWFLMFYVRSYWWLLRSAPSLWRWLFERRQRKLHRATAPRWVFRHGCKKVLEQLKTFAPHLVIANEIGAVEIAALETRRVVSRPHLGRADRFPDGNPPGNSGSRCLLCGERRSAFAACELGNLAQPDSGLWDPHRSRFFASPGIGVNSGKLWVWMLAGPSCW